MFCCFVDFIQSSNTWLSVQTCKTAVLLRWSSLDANDKRRAPIVAASSSSFGTLSCLIGATLLLPIKNLHSMTVSSKLCIRKNRTAAIPMSEASVNACISKLHDLLLWFGNKILGKVILSILRKESRNFCNLCWWSLGIWLSHFKPSLQICCSRAFKRIVTGALNPRGSKIDGNKLKSFRWV